MVCVRNTVGNSYINASGHYNPKYVQNEEDEQQQQI